MTKKDIIRTVSEQIGLTQPQTTRIVQKIFNSIVETLVTERRIELRNFGVFEVKHRAARKARNPRTDEKIFVPEKYAVTFKPGKEMENRVKKLKSQSDTHQAESLPLHKTSTGKNSRRSKSKKVYWVVLSIPKRF